MTESGNVHQWMIKQLSVVDGELYNGLGCHHLNSLLSLSITKCMSPDVMKHKLHSTTYKI